MAEQPIKVSQAVLDGIDAVRESGETNMCDYNAVMRLAFDSNYHATVDWMANNKKAYVKGIFAGFEVT